MIGDPLLGPASDDEGPTPDDLQATARRPAARAPGTAPDRDADAVGEPAATRELPDAAPHHDPSAAPDSTRSVPAPVLPPGGLRPGAPPPGDLDPLWAATVARPDPAPVDPQRPPVAGQAPAIPMVEVHELAPTTATPVVAGDDLAATTAMSAVAVEDLTATTAMPGVARSIGPHDTMVMPAVAAPAPGAEHAPGFERTMRRHRRRWWRRSFKALVLLVLLGVVYVGVNFALVVRTANIDQARAVDVIVVLGAAQYDGRPSPQLEARLDHTIDLWNEGLAPIVFVTGGNQPGDAHTEAESSRDYLVERGVPAEAIQMEDTARSTWESLSNFAETAAGQGWERVLLVTDPFHSLRTRLIAQELGFTAYTSPTQTSPVQGREELMKEIKEALGISVGRIIGFERLWKVTG